MRDAELAPPTIDPALAFLAGGGEMGALIRGHDWKDTPLGPAALWPQSLKTAVRIMLSSRQPIWIGWGQTLAYLYNDAYQSIIGGKHPRALGRPAEEVWREIWGEIGPMLDTTMGGVEGTHVEEQLLIMERNGYPEETYYTYSYTPIPDDDGTPGGIICANTDDTQRVIGERQLALLREVSARTADARSRTEVCERGIGALAGDPRDLTFALLYMVSPAGGAATLAAATGLRPGHPAAPASLPLGPGAPWPIGEVIANHDLRLIEEPAAGFDDGLPGGAWERPTAKVAVLALPASGEAGRAGALVVGLNPFRLFDQDYRGFLRLVAGQIAAAVANADAYEEERRRAEALAELDLARRPAEHVRNEAASAAAPSRAQEFVDEALRWLPDAAATASPSLGAFAPAPLAPAGAGRHVLLAGDNADMRSYVARLLESHGYAVEAVADGEAAMAAARGRPPDLILTDVMMPKMDGFGLLRAIRAETAIAGTPVIMLSARAGEDAKVEGLEAGADDYLVKPFAARELLARVNANIQLAELRRETNRAIFQSEQRFLLAQDRLGITLSTGRVAVFEWDPEADRVAVFGSLAKIFGVDEEEAATAGLPLGAFIDGVHPDDRARVRAAIDASLEGGQPYQIEYRVTGRLDGEERIVLARAELNDDPGGSRLSGAIIDVTEDRLAQRLIEEKQAALADQTNALEILNRAAAAISGDLDLERLVQTVTDAAVELTGAEFGAFFYNVVDADGERYTLYTLSGAERSAFAAFPMPRNTEVFATTFAGQAVVRSEDITKDPRYGRSAPHHGMPKGHLPVRSYLAAPVRSRDGEVLGGLFFGHSRPGVFGVLSEERIVGLASQAAVAMDNARLFQAAERELEQHRRAEAELQALNAGLEGRVAAEVAERNKAEDALRQAQKMEAVGQLTGGVAHDFNNLLTVIIGGLDSIKRSRPGDEARIRRAADMALQGAQRAASLTGRLLAFSRRQPLDPRPLDLNQRVRDMTELLHRTLGEQVELEGVLAPRLWRIEADQNQLESAILNLAVNARDAMPEGGKLTIETANTALDESYAAVDSEVTPGQYVVIAVSDSGCGMSKEIQAKVFEPFFTTKDVDRGTGLGLSMVYGFVKQSGGHVTVYSEEGQGTTVKLYFPRYEGSARPEGAAGGAALPLGSDDEVILVVEDNDAVRANSILSLQELGYQVVEAAEADAALEIIRSARRIDLLFTDVVLPGKSGRVLADAARTLRPELKVLFTTGYSRNAIVHHGRLDPGVQLLTKPFTYEQLATRVRDMLDRG